MQGADLISKFQIGPDGRTAFERVKGKPLRRETVEFGERVHYRIGKLDKIRKMDPRWAEGVFLGGELEDQ